MYSIPSYRTLQTVLVTGNKLREKGELCKQRGTACVPHLTLSWSRFSQFGKWRTDTFYLKTTTIPNFVQKHNISLICLLLRLWTTGKRSPNLSKAPRAPNNFVLHQKHFKFRKLWAGDEAVCNSLFRASTTSSSSTSIRPFSNTI